MKNVNDLQALLETKEEMKKRITSKILDGIQVLASAKKLVVINEEINVLQEYIDDSRTESYLAKRKERKLKRILDTDGLGEEVMLQYKADVNMINWILS